VLIPTRRGEDLFAGWWQLLAGLGAVPRVLVWDGEPDFRRSQAHEGLIDRVGAGQGGAVRP
jgi:hypothetical protein